MITLSTYHSPEVCTKGNDVQQRRKNNKKRESKKTEVRCMMQYHDYSAQFHWINKGNGKEALYDLKGSSKVHNWSLKLVFRLMNMHNLDTYMLYRRLHQLDTPDFPVFDMDDTMVELTPVLYSGPMRKQKPEYLVGVSNVQAEVFSPGIRAEGQEYSAWNYAYRSLNNISF